MFLIFDTETTGLPKNYAAPLSNTDNWPRCVQIAWQLHDAMGKLLEHQDYLIKPVGFNIPYDAEKVHGISTELAEEQGSNLHEILLKFKEVLGKTKFIVGQNVGFDVNILGCEFYRENIETSLSSLPILDTCTEVTASLLKLPGGRGGKFKLPTLSELHIFLFNEPFAETHNATADVEATTRCFFELIRQNIFTKEELDVEQDYFNEFNRQNPKPIELIGLKHLNLKEVSHQLHLKNNTLTEDTPPEISPEFKGIHINDCAFVHLHNHSQFSVLQSTISVKNLVKKAAEHKMPAVALTDFSNLMGAFTFLNELKNHNEYNDFKIKGIIGCEFNVCENHLDRSKKDNGFQIVFLAKNKKGYENISKMSSIAHTQGFYYVPRIDKNIVEKYTENLIVLTGGLMGEIPNKLLNVGEKQAEEALLWWKNLFQDDLYIELTRHNQEDETRVNKSLVAFARKHSIKLVATNNVFYSDENASQAHDIMLCVKEGEKKATPIGRGRGYRFGLPNQEYYFKSGDEMKKLFFDLPEAIIHTQEIVSKIDEFTLDRDVLLPKFEIPNEFLDHEDETDAGKRGENKYLRFLTYKGAEKKYKTITPEIQKRLDFELEVIANTGYPGYFLIVQDFIAEARKMGVSVGPGRGSAAGSAVAYCLSITNIDPLPYNLLFERFLNPERVSMPDIDIDFDDEGREKVINYVINKYGKRQVAQIITYGTMAAKSALRDTARVLDLSLFEADKIAKLIPNQTATLAIILDTENSKLKENFRSDELDKVNELRRLVSGNDLVAETIKQAKVLEGSIRNTGTHACGVIITPDDISNLVPVINSKDEGLLITQFDNSVVESAGLLKMDFLGLKTLTLIKDTIKLLKFTKNIDLDPDLIPIDDEKTYQLFQRGETVGIFQYESNGMQKFLRQLKPTVFEDLIAMNALYRPGPMDYIPSFINRKNGLEPITYDIEDTSVYLKDTYGITVYQEQVMLLSQQLADFTKGEADVLRKAMGKKQKDTLNKMKFQFINQASVKGYEPKILEKIWADWEAFAGYAFNKSHATCYAWIGYQTAYLKAHYPAEYMAAVLSNNMNNIKQVSFFMEECLRMGIQVLGPDVNESFYKFTVTPNNVIRFGMGAVKGVGQGAVSTIVEKRKTGKYISIFDFAKRVDLGTCNKKAFDNLALAGGFDCFSNTHRAQFFHHEGDSISFIEKVIKFGGKFQENENSSQVSLFGESSDVQIAEPALPICEEWIPMEKLAKEREVVGIYISGHPLDNFKFEMKYFANSPFDALNNLNQFVNKNLSYGGMITKVEHKVAKNGKGWAIFTLESYESSADFKIFGEEYLKYRHFLVVNNFTFFKIYVKEGWINPEGVKTEPRLQFTDILQLADVLPKFAKKIVVTLPINQFDQKFVEDLYTILNKQKGTHPLSFEIVETETIVPQVVMKPKNETEYEPAQIITDDEENFENIEQNFDIQVAETPEIIKTKLILQSIKTKLNICPELLQELERLNIKFRLN